MIILKISLIITFILNSVNFKNGWISWIRKRNRLEDQIMLFLMLNPQYPIELNLNKGNRDHQN